MEPEALHPAKFSIFKMTELRQILELDMPSNGKNVDRAAPILNIGWVYE
jgi:hypothetical protein